MKYIVLLLMVLAGIWWIRKQRPNHTDTPPGQAGGPQTMVSCVQCGVHLPENDAVHGKKGVYCSEAHRQLLET
jgi:uncharacterized protein